jgi:hypothetical protein
MEPKSRSCARSSRVYKLLRSSRIQALTASHNQGIVSMMQGESSFGSDSRPCRIRGDRRFHDQGKPVYLHSLRVGNGIAIGCSVEGRREHARIAKYSSSQPSPLPLWNDTRCELRSELGTCIRAKCFHVRHILHLMLFGNLFSRT